MIDRLIERIKETGAPIVVGLDPMLRFIPEGILRDAFGRYGETPAGAAEAVWQFNRAIVDAVADLVPAVKPAPRAWKPSPGPSGTAMRRDFS